MRILLGLDVVKEVIIFEFFIAVLIMIFTPNESNFMGTQFKDFVRKFHRCKLEIMSRIRVEEDVAHIELFLGPL